MNVSATPAALDITGLTKHYGGLTALDSIDLQVAPGDFFALLGPNGAGKSTTIGVICSLVRKTAGQVKVFGHDIDTDLARAKQCIGVVPQEFNFNIFENVRDIVLNQAGYYGLARGRAAASADKYLKQLGLWDKRAQQSRTLSGGMKRRLMIARALVHEPQLLILDEPTAGVDIELRRSMWDFLREINANGTTIILTTHYLEEAENLCRNVAIIDRGRIIENTSIKALLSSLNQEVFVLDTRAQLSAPPQLDGFAVELRDSHTLEVAISRDQSVTQLVGALAQQGITVVSMRSKANRLEELFVRLVGEGRAKS